MAKTEVVVKLSGEDGNIFAILARVGSALRQAGHKDLVSEMNDEVFATNDYHEALAKVMKYVEVE